MKRLLMIAFLVFVLLSSGIQAEVPNTISYQGILATSGGDIVPDGNYDLTFRLYNVQTGGSQLWQEDHNNVPVYQGRFNIILGSLVNLSSVPFDEPYWLGITVEPPSTELPRIEFTSSAYSLNARSIIDNAVTSTKIQDGTIVDGDISNSADISASKINDGPGSGLDADLLDGQHASAFLSTANDYGRSGVATNLYEGTSTLASKYVDEGQSNSITSDMITNGTIQFSDIGQNSAGSGQVMKWNGSAWAAANDNTGSGVTDHGALTGLGDDDHQQYLLVSRSDFISQFTGRLDIQQSDIQRLMDFKDARGYWLGSFKRASDGNLQLLARDRFLLVSSDAGIICTNEGNSTTVPIYASSFLVASTRAVKTNIKYLTNDDYQQALADISSLRPAVYQFKDSTSGKGTHLGLIAEEVPSEILAPRGDAVDLYALTTKLLAAVKALKAQVDQQAEIIEELRGR